jgi:hypothetical protein
MVANTRKILYTATTNENNRVFLKVVSNTGDIGGNLSSVGKTHTSDLPES